MSIRTINLGLRPTPTQSMTLGVLQDAFAAACNHMSAVAWQEQEFHRVGLQHLVYQDVRALYGLTAQHTIRAIAVRLSTCGAPVRVDVRLSKHQAQILASGPRLAEADLVQDRKGRWRFLISAHFPDAPRHACAHTLGVDLGRRDIAHTSDDAAWNGGPVQARRDHYAKVRRSMQKRATQGTRSTRRRCRTLQKRLARRERLFQVVRSAPGLRQAHGFSRGCMTLLWCPRRVQQGGRRTMAPSMIL
jgi:putative transposase